MLTNGPKKIAVIHDWLLGFRGGEEVLQAILEIYPTADIFTLFYKKGSVSPEVELHSIKASFLNRIPLAHRYYRHLLPLMPLAIEKFDLTDYDLVISSSHCVAKGVIPSPGALHVTYCHTAIRYAWDRYKDYFLGSRIEPFIYPVTHYLRLWDATSSQRVDHFIANSNWVRDRIRVFYRRNASVIHPFVDLSRFSPTGGDLGDYYLVVSAFAPYKKIELAIDACKKMNRRLLIVGDGQGSAKLKKLAGPQTEFLGRVSHSQLRDLYAGALALLFPGEEDFGIVPLQAMACGRPVIAYNRGGVLDSVLPGKTGILFEHQTTDSLIEAIELFEKTKTKFDSKEIVKHARGFSRERFLVEFRTLLGTLWTRHCNRAKTAPDFLEGTDLNPPAPFLE